MTRKVLTMESAREHGLLYVSICCCLINTHNEFIKGVPNKLSKKRNIPFSGPCLSKIIQKNPK
jgi:hypothetical protein